MGLVLAEGQAGATISLCSLEAELGMAEPGDGNFGSAGLTLTGVRW